MAYAQETFVISGGAAGNGSGATMIAQLQQAGFAATYSAPNVDITVTMSGVFTHAMLRALVRKVQAAGAKLTITPSVTPTTAETWVQSGGSTNSTQIYPAVVFVDGQNGLVATYSAPNVDLTPAAITDGQLDHILRVAEANNASLTYTASHS